MQLLTILKNLIDLHSTMYLLNRSRDFGRWATCKHLHSTMYLLNLGEVEEKFILSEFTFHYVSIKSESLGKYNLYQKLFTFHYVSIKSDPPGIQT